ncbi:piggyBac transposable element-derived protein 4 [Trichonephila clavipes]|nr:piggyBac transposable element-derived protein 4 [Trichonephila clavipes]
MYSRESRERQLKSPRDFPGMEKPGKSETLAPSRFSFTGDVGMKACVTNISDTLEYFKLFLTDEIINHIVTETNIFAAEKLNKFKSKEHSRELNHGNVQ